jgi:hypothetical protein
MVLTELQMKGFCLGLKQGFYLRFSKKMSQYLILKDVNLQHKKKNIIQQE